MGQGALGWETLLNRAGTTFRKLPDKDKDGLTEKKAIALMLAQPSMIKRPVLEKGAKLMAGFKPEIYEKVFRVSIYVGVGGWVFEEWRDNFYPKDSAARSASWNMPAASSPPSRSTAPITARKSRKVSPAGMTKRRTISSSP